MKQWSLLSKEEKKRRIKISLSSRYGFIAYAFLFLGISSVFGLIKGEGLRLLVSVIGGVICSLIVFIGAMRVKK